MVSPNTQDEAFHEIQLNGKQLVFLFMAATVASVMIFLCGVLVGRGARVDRAAPDSSSTAGEVAVAPAAEPVPQPPPAQATAAAAPAGSDPTAAQAPPPTADEVSYPGRLQEKKPPHEQLKSSASGPAPASPKPAAKAAPAAPKLVAEAAPAAPKPVAEAAPAAPKPVAEVSPASATEPSGSGYAVQIAALNVRSEADAIARRLSAKGYAAYVLTPPAGSPSVFRVRVGKFKTHREAETVAAKLQKEEQFTPWITR